VKRAALSLIAGGILIAGLAGQASGKSPFTGCPPSYQVWDISTQPYQADNLVDQKGNNDGTVCAKQIDDKTFALNGAMFPLYNFIDNAVPTR
jgi:hypothetical protein